MFIDDERHNVGWWVAWVAVPTLITGGAVGAMVKGGTPGLVTGAATLLAMAYALWRRFWS